MQFVLTPLALALLALPTLCQDLAVRAERLITMAGPPIADGVVWIEGGKIKAVGAAGDVTLPASLPVLRAKVATPGLVDAHTVVGLAGWLNQDHDQDQLDRSSPLQPELRAIDAYNPREPLVEWLRSFGVTTIHTGHSPGAVIAGQTMIAKTAGDTVAEAVVVERAMVAAALNEDAVGGDGKPGTRSKAAAILRAKLLEAANYAQKRADDEATPRDLALEVLADVLAGELPLLITAQRARDIETALRIAEEFGFRLVLDGCAEAYLLLEELKAANVPIIVHPTMVRAYDETENLSLETPKLLLEAGLLVALQSGYESYVPKTRVVLFEAAMAAAHGLAFERALGLVTIDAARVLGVDERVGSLEVGKDGDVALYDGDPFESTTHCVGTVIEGVRVSAIVR
ncbi:MAG: amidohydrolase family protein [Planctomycetota bacterium]